MTPPNPSLSPGRLVLMAGSATLVGIGLSLEDPLFLPSSMLLQYQIVGLQNLGHHCTLVAPQE